MRIVENTPERLRLHDSSLWICATGFAAAAVMAGFAVRLGDPRGLVGAALFAAFGLAFLRATDVVVDKSARTVAVRRRGPFGIRRAVLPFRDIADVRVETTLGGRYGDVIVCRLSLVTTSDVLPLTGSFEPGLVRYDEMRAALLGVLFPTRPRPAPTDPGKAMVGFGLPRRRDLAPGRERFQGDLWAGQAATPSAGGRGAAHARRRRCASLRTTPST